MWDTDAVDTLTGDDDLQIEELEWRVSAVYLLRPDAHALYPVDAQDVHDQVSQAILRAVNTLVQTGERINPINIRELSHVPQEEIDKRISAFNPAWMLDMDTYARRIQAEGFRTRAMWQHRQAQLDLAKCAWRDIQQTHEQHLQHATTIHPSGGDSRKTEAGYLFEQLIKAPEETMRPLPLSWGRVNRAIKGGLFQGKKYVFLGIPGARKTSALFTAMHHIVFTLGKRWIHFPFDGGSINEQLLKFFVVRWTHLLLEADVPLTCQAQVETSSGIQDISNFTYVNTIAAYKVLKLRDAGEPLEGSGLVLPPGAYDLFDQACRDMVALQSKQGPGLLEFVSPLDVSNDVYRMAQWLRRSLYDGDGLDGFSVDHIAEPENQFTDPQKRMPENTRILTGFTKTYGPPCIIISHVSIEGAENLGKPNADPRLRYNQELYQAADGAIAFIHDAMLPNEVTIHFPKNREGPGGNAKGYRLRIQPDSGYVWDDPFWDQNGPVARQTTGRNRRKQQVSDD